MVSPKSREAVELIVLEASGGPEGTRLGEGSIEFLQLADEQNTETCVVEMAPLQRKIGQWAAGKGNCRAVVDFTGGTKCMSAAIAIVAARAPCIFSYVGSKGGAAGRDRGGTGVVRTGSEMLVSQFNPWKSLGFEVYEDAALLFNQHLYAAAATRLEQFHSRLPAESPLRPEFGVLGQFARGYADWDRFDHGAALEGLGAVRGKMADLPQGIRRAVTEKLNGHIAFLGILAGDKSPEQSAAFIGDLLANAGRRAAGGRYDDAVARLYRAAEAFAQGLLRPKGIDSAAVRLDQLPAELRDEWGGRFGGGRQTILLGLRDNYKLLKALKLPEGQRFNSLGLHRPESPLNDRNNSILAHGYKALGVAGHEKLKSTLLRLTKLEPDARAEFPVLPANL